MKRIISLLLVILISFTAIPFSTGTVYAASAVWDGTADTSWYTGDKAAYDISTPQQLAGLSELVNSGNAMSGITFNLTADLVMNETTGWKEWYSSAPANVFTPIGKSGNPIGGYYPFSGLFNGNGHTISGLYVNSGRTAGLFGYLFCAGVSSVIIEKSVIIGYDNLKGTGVYVGGITGIAEGSVISQCENDGYLYAVGQGDMSNGDRNAYVGGIAGSLQTENVSSVTLGLMFAAGGMFANPLLFNDGTGGFIKSSGIVNCVSGGKLNIYSGTTGYIGGIVGWGNNGLVKNSLVGCDFFWKRGKPDVLGNYHGTIYRGTICGGVYCCSMENVYHLSGYSMNGIGHNQSMAAVGEVFDNAVGKTYEEMTTKEFAELLGAAFVYIDGERPYLACDRRVASIIERTNKITSFAERLYTTLLCRPSDPSGLEDWVEELKKGTTAAEVASGFVLSKELSDKNLSNTEFVKRMYRTFLNREADESGLADWVNALDNGCSYAYILNSFAGSAEFGAICEEYGITAGSYAVTEPRDRNSGLTRFVSRIYTKALGRDFDLNGLNDWTGRYLNGEANAADISYGFIFSQEFTGKNLSDEAYVETLYATFFDRPSDEGGKANWLNLMANGTSREEVLDGFLGSQEFINLKATFGV